MSAYFAATPPLSLSVVLILSNPPTCGDSTRLLFLFSSDLILSPPTCATIVLSPIVSNVSGPLTHGRDGLDEVVYNFFFGLCNDFSCPLLCCPFPNPWFGMFQEPNIFPIGCVKQEIDQE